MGYTAWVCFNTQYLSIRSVMEKNVFYKKQTNVWTGSKVKISISDLLTAND